MPNKLTSVASGCLKENIDEKKFYSFGFFLTVVAVVWVRLLYGRGCRSGLGRVPRRAGPQPVFHFGADQPFQCKPAPGGLGVPHTGFGANAVQPPHSGWGAVWNDGLHPALRRGCGHGEGTMEKELGGCRAVQHQPGADLLGEGGGPAHPVHQRPLAVRPGR